METTNTCPHCGADHDWKLRSSACYERELAQAKELADKAQAHAVNAQQGQSGALDKVESLMAELAATKEQLAKAQAKSEELKTAGEELAHRLGLWRISDGSFLHEDDKLAVEAWARAMWEDVNDSKEEQP